MQNITSIDTIYSGTKEAAGCERFTILQDTEHLLYFVWRLLTWYVSIIGKFGCKCNSDSVLEYKRYNMTHIKSTANWKTLWI